MQKIIQARFEEHLEVANAVMQSDIMEQIERVATVVKIALGNGKKVLFCGNGGSAADSQHLAAEFVGRFQKERQGLPAIALTVDTSILTAVGNDYGFDKVFARQVEALGKLNINNKKVLKALKNSLMDSSPMVRINAIEAIMNSGEENSVELIRPSLNDDDDDVKKNALIAIYNLIGRDILDEVLSLPSYSQYLKEVAQELIDEYEVDGEVEDYE